MIELTGYEIVNTLVMDRQVDGRRVIVVEGQEDFQLLELHLDESAAYLEFAGSKNAVLKAAELCVDDNIDWVIFVVDADFDRITGLIDSYPSNVVASDGYDLLMDVVNVDGSLVSRAIITHAPPNTERKIRETFGVAPLDIAQILSSPVGALRYRVVSGSLELSVRNWPFDGLAQAYLNGELNRTVSMHAEERSARRVAASEIEEQIRNLLVDSEAGESRLVSGHDLAAAIAETVRFQSGKSLGHDWICAAIRVALACVEFQKLSVIQEINRWSQVTGGALFTCRQDAA